MMLDAGTKLEGRSEENSPHPRIVYRHRHMYVQQATQERMMFKYEMTTDDMR